MADNSAIEWTDATWNPTVGCSVLSPGCSNCYAMKVAHRFGGSMPWSPAGKNAKYAGLTREVNFNAVWTGKVRLDESALTKPLGWKKPRRIFVNSMSDLFHESLPDEAIDRVFAVMALCPQHTFQVLTKRAERMHRYMTEVVKGPWAGRAHVIEDDGTQRSMTDVHFRMNGVMCDLYPKTPPQALNFAAKWADDHYPDGDGFLRCWPLPNVWLGVSVEDQQRADERIPLLLDTPASKRFISAEPLLGPLDLHNLRTNTYDAITGCGDVERLTDWGSEPSTRLDWVIAGGESGPGARPMHREWARKLRGDCVLADVPFFFKQWGEWQPHTVVAGGDLGADMRADRVRIVHPSARSNVEISVATGGYSTEPGSRYMARVGKKAAGRLLDGREWSEFPA